MEEGRGLINTHLIASRPVLFPSKKALCYFRGALLSVRFSPMALKTLCFRKRIEGTFPNCEIALRLVLTVPVTVASGERSFSKLKLIKNYLRSTMSQDRLCGRALISIEKDVACKLRYNDLIAEFAAKKTRKVNFP